MDLAQTLLSKLPRLLAAHLTVKCGGLGAGRAGAQTAGSSGPKVRVQSGALNQTQSKVVPRAGADLEMGTKLPKQGTDKGTLDIISGAVKQLSDKIFGASQATLSPPLARILPRAPCMEAPSQPSPHGFFLLPPPQ